MPGQHWVACGVLALCGAARAQFPYFQGVGDLQGGGFASRALGVGRFEKPPVIVGESLTADGWRAFTLTLPGGPPSAILELPSLSPSDQFSSAAAVARTRMEFFAPLIVAGSSGFAPSVAEASAVRWAGTPLVPQPVGPLTGAFTASLAHAISDDGLVVAGEGFATPGGPRAFRWTAASGLHQLGSLAGAGPDNSAAHGLSKDGSVVVGSAQTATFEIVAMRWTEATGMVALGHLNTTGFLDSRARGCSADGAVVVGESTSPSGPQEAFRWTSAGGMVGLGDLPGGAFRSAALATTWAGDLVVGWSESDDGEQAFVWDPVHGMRDLKSVLALMGFSTSGWTLQRVNAISGTGRVMVGDGINPFGQPEGWVFNRECYTDCNGDGKRTASDYACYQTRFVLNHWWCDCNGVGGFTIADFGCWHEYNITGGRCPDLP